MGGGEGGMEWKGNLEEEKRVKMGNDKFIPELSRFCSSLFFSQ